MTPMRRAGPWRVVTLIVAILLIPQSMTLAGVRPGTTDSGTTLATGSTLIPPLKPGAHPLTTDEEAEEELLQQDLAFISERLAGTSQLTAAQAGQLRAQAAKDAAALKQIAKGAATTFDSASWNAVGPDPLISVARSSNDFYDVSGRIGALAIRPSTGQFILGAAQGGIWLYDPESGMWTPKTDDQPSLAIGSLAVAPSQDNIVYAGTGEGALSGDSYFGNGIMKSTDGGDTWSHVSGDFFVAVSVSRLVVDPNDPNHLWAAVISGRGGARRTAPPIHSQLGIWESHDGAATWTLLKAAPKAQYGATDLEVDPQDTQVMYASFWGDSIYKSTNGGATWAPIMTGLPTVHNFDNLTRWSIGLSHPEGQSAVLYVGSDYIDDSGTYHKSQLWRSDDEGASWNALPTGTGGNSVLDYCGGQCWYDNVVEVDPNDPNIVFAAGQFNYGIGSGGIYRSDDGGQTWKNLGYNQHPDFHALAMDPANTAHVLIGSDGGVWYSDDRGGRPGAVTDTKIADADWQNLNGNGLVYPAGLQITQFTSIATVPGEPGVYFGGSQDNGTEGVYRPLMGPFPNLWADTASGDGGQALVDPTDPNYVYGTYYGISPYRFSDGGNSFFTNSYIQTGINLNDRSDFYVPFTMNRNNPNQLFLGTFRLYRTDNAKAPSAGDVTWQAVSGDLTSGCKGTAPNGARNCSISAIGVGGGTGVYTGSLDGLVYFSPDAQSSDSPTWTRVDQSLPARPVASIYVDRSNDRIAYLAYNGFNAGTPGRPGHVFKTTDAGNHWQDVSGNLPDSPVNSIIADPSFPNTLYAGTDVGAFVSYDGGKHWGTLGSGFPVVAIWQLDFDSVDRVLAAGTHGRGAWAISDSNQVPSLVVSKVDAGIPVGPSSEIDYTIKLQNIGNADATGVKVTDPVPAYTTFAGADNDGRVSKKGVISWTNLTVPAGGTINLHFSVDIDAALKAKVSSITNDGITVTSAEGPGATGSPTVTSIAAPFALDVAPASQVIGAHPGESGAAHITVRNDGYMTDSYNLTATGNTYPVSFFASDCTTALAGDNTGPLTAGQTMDVCVEVTPPAAAAGGDSDTATVTATSVGDSSQTASATVTTVVVTADTLLVDNDGNSPDVQSYYTAALDANGVNYAVWDLASDPNLPAGYLAAFKNVVWFTGNSYPDPIGPYENMLKPWLDGGGNLFLTGQDILDQAAGTTSFFSDYVHVNWDGSETQNDIRTNSVTGVTGNPVTDGIGTIAIDHTVLGAVYEDEITPIGPAQAAFTDDASAPDALTFSDAGSAYRIVFLAFPFEAYGTAADKADLMGRVMTFFTPTP